MLPAIYESVPHRIAVLTWPEASAADLRLLVGTENVNVTPSVIQVCNGEDSGKRSVTAGPGPLPTVQATGT
jgi:hypothetical protein